VDEETPKPLPNLDYKIMVGDSLVSKFEHTVIEIDWDKTMSVGEGDVHIKTMQKALQDISDKQKQFFDINNHNKKLILKTEIRNLKLDILIAQLSFNRAAFVNKNQIIMEMGFGLTTKDQKDNLEIKKNIKDFNDVIEKLETLKTNDKPFNHFDWTLDFPIELNPYLVTDSNQRGFDIVIANPPYIGQSGNRNLFQQVLQTNFGKTFHQRRMDYFYFFIHKAIRVAKHDTILSFITTNYFLNATYADKLRKDLFENCDFLKLINFNEAKIFESATGQHNAISILTKKKNINNYVETAITSHKGIISGKVIYDILYGNDALSKKFNFLTTNIFEPPKYHILIEGTGHEENYNNKASILNSIKDSSLRLIEVVDIVQGIVTGANDLSPKYKKDYSISEEEGSGIFVLQKKELENIKINSKEKTFIKPWYKNSDIQRWTCNEKTNQYLIYITSIDVIDESEIPNLINHFEPYKKLLINRNVRTGRYSLSDYNDFLKGSLDIPYVMIKSSFKKGHYYLVSYARDKYVFEGPKIICPQRSPINTFGYSLASWYGASDVYYIIEKKDKAYNLKYLLAILNSKLIYFWLYNKGQRKGQTLQLFKDPLSEIPIKHPLNSNFYIYSKIVDYILYLKKKTIININEELITPYFEQIINGMVYELYFPELLKKHNCQIIEYLGELPELNVEMSEEQKMEVCKEVFDRLNDENHQVKINLEKMKEIKEIRIMEGLEN
jgi:adenine-specific DNA-methyltransferase